MARPLGIYERLTTSTLPPPDQSEGRHVVLHGENLITVATSEYGLQQYDENLWRDMGIANGVENPFTFDADFRGQAIRIPSKPLPDFL